MKFKYILFTSAILLSFSSCEKFLDRPPLTTLDDNSNGWTSENKVRLYANKYYTDYFEGYGSGFSSGNVPLIGNTNNDDMVVLGNQPNLTRSVPNSGIWSYSNVRSINIMIDRVETRMSNILTAEAKNHWLAVGKFFRAFEYAELVRIYGDVPYIDKEVADTDLNELYKARTPRNEVMDHVYADWRFVLDNIRTNDGDQNLNRFIAAGFISRLALIEASWQKYHYNNAERAKKFYELVVECAQIDMNSGKYDIVTDYKLQFTSKDLKGNKDMVLYRVYDGAQNIRHSIASNSNLQESTNNGPTTDLLKAYLCTDGRPFENSTLADAAKFDLANMIKTRDPRFEATFYSKPNALNRSSMYYITKYFPREIEKAVKVNGQALPAEYTGDKNETDAPVLRYAEVLLNWIEAKAELETLGGVAVSQDDINKSINKIRLRPVAQEALDRGVSKVSNLVLGAIPVDPNRDPEVSPLLWEIRRERRLEFAFETFRLTDLRRWKKLEYIDNTLNKDLMSGGWVNFSTELSTELAAKNVNVLSVVDLTGKETIYNGSNGGLMIGFYKNQTNKPRLPFLNIANINPYLTPVGLVQIDQYASRGYVLKQTEGWPQN
ncbi:RagB/SusD domain protein [Pseudopedobacter saltans DSM 12145]|uniref:RagB/SusD domain protein n=1 Tax=Pseudopedobacter saltans (strain ATCC 51119 / DSM 12145 / JCM 21818 / CCUG 39354 / LMG 10337 / NBRC 100064 / NCIMB 13643) TaxID=762903 RepID=F0S8S9_PSESL|nr:RagB/SusD family nutrient uptake outer membrane protein [Pseudopedobacter saltans]ADY52410.1 RagB/SusD domain protein [Pseudopedobacter saltans DSM 12145]